MNYDKTVSIPNHYNDKVGDFNDFQMKLVDK